MIDTVIFDLGGVLFDWNPRYLYRKIFSDPKEMETFLTEVCNHDWNIQQDGGRTWAEAIQELVPKFPHYESEIRAFWERWPEMLKGTIDETLVVFRALQKAGYTCYALTNWSAETWVYPLADYPFLQEFKGILVSGEEHMKKPDPEIYELILSRYDIDRTKAVFIDDSKANVAGSKAVGLEAIRFTNAETLKNDLHELGLKF